MPGLEKSMPSILVEQSVAAPTTIKNNSAEGEQRAKCLIVKESVLSTKILQVILSCPCHISMLKKSYHVFLLKVFYFCFFLKNFRVHIYYHSKEVWRLEPTAACPRLAHRLGGRHTPPPPPPGLSCGAHSGRSHPCPIPTPSQMSHL